MLLRSKHTFRYILFPFLMLIYSFGIPATANGQTVSPDLHFIRKSVMTALDNKPLADSLYTSISALKNRTPLINGYLGALEALKAKNSWNPYFKLKYLNDSEDTFKTAVASDPHNIEIRFLRFSIEHHVPSFLGYNKNLTGDRLEMVKQIDSKNYAQADQHMVKVIILFLIDSKRCTPSEQKRLQQQLAAL